MKKNLWMLAAKLAKRRAMLQGLAGDLHNDLTQAEREKLEAEAEAAQLALDLQAAEMRRRKSVETIGSATQGRLQALENLKKVEEKEAKAKEKMKRLAERPDSASSVSDMEMTPSQSPQMARKGPSMAGGLGGFASAFGGGGGFGGGKPKKADDGAAAAAEVPEETITIDTTIATEKDDGVDEAPAATVEEDDGDVADDEDGEPVLDADGNVVPPKEKYIDPSTKRKFPVSMHNN